VGQDFTTNDPAAGGGSIRNNNYTFQPALRCDGVNPIEIGVFCHEFGHSFGRRPIWDVTESYADDLPNIVPVIPGVPR